MYHTLFRRCSSTVERSFRKAEVESSILSIGCVDIQKKRNSLKKNLTELGRVVVAYSGGVDSTFLLKVAVDTLSPQNVLACIAISPSLAKSQYAQAIEYAKIIGAKIEEVKVDELSDNRYLANKADRCFHCKSHLFSALTDIAKEKGFEFVVCGNNFDDFSDYRPGNRAAEIFNIHAPLAKAEMTKNDIRKLSKQLNLPTAELPASPCLSSRIAYGLEITVQRLKQIEQAEDFLRTLGLVEFRVRHHDRIARIELHAEDLPKVTTEPARSKIEEKLKSIGFKFVTVDLTPFRSGSLNQLLSDTEKQKNH